MTGSYRLHDLPALAGEQIVTSAWQTISQADIDAFGELTGDRQWIHVDPDAAAAGPFGTTIAHGYLTLSLIGGLWSTAFDVVDASTKINYGMDRVRFVTPVAVGARVRLRSRLTEVGRRRSGLRLYVDQTIELEHSDRPALVARCIYDFLTDDATRDVCDTSQSTVPLSINTARRAERDG